MRSIVNSLKLEHGLAESSGNTKEASLRARNNWRRLRDFLFEPAQKINGPCFHDTSAMPLCGLMLERRVELQVVRKVNQILFLQEPANRIVCLDGVYAHFFDAENAAFERSLSLPTIGTMRSKAAHSPQSSGRSSRMSKESVFMSPAESNPQETDLETEANPNCFKESFRIVYAPKSNLIVAWIPGSRLLFPLHPDSLEIAGMPTETVGALLNVITDVNNGCIISFELGCECAHPSDPDGLKTPDLRVDDVVFVQSWCFRYTKNELVAGSRVRVFKTLDDPIRCYARKPQPIRSLSAISQLSTFHLPDQLISMERTSENRPRILIGWRCQALLCQLSTCGRFCSKLEGEHSRATGNPAAASDRRAVHEYQVTSVLFFDPLSLLITGDCSGCIKIWHSNFQQIGVLTSHSCEITHLMLHPLSHERPNTTATVFTGFLSASQDGTLKSWEFIKWKHMPPSEELSTKFGRSIHHVEEDPAVNIQEVDSVSTLTYRTVDKAGHRSDGYKELCLFLCQPKNGLLGVIGCNQTSFPLKAGTQAVPKLVAEFWRASCVGRSTFRFPEPIKHLSVVYISDNSSLNMDENKPVNITSSEAVIVVVCAGKPGSVHLFRAPQWTVITSAVSEEEVNDAVWQWTTEKLFVLQKDLRIAVFSTLSRPCSLLDVWSAQNAQLQFSGPLHLYPTSNPDWLRKLTGESTPAKSKPTLLLMCGRSDGSLVILCPNRGITLTEVMAHKPRPDNSGDYRVSGKGQQQVQSEEEPIEPILSIESDPVSGRLVTTGSDGSILLWSAINPLPLNLITDATALQKLTLIERVVFTQFPFTPVRQSQMFCLYSCPFREKNTLGFETTQNDSRRFLALCVEGSSQHSPALFSRTLQLITSSPLKPTCIAERTGHLKGFHLTQAEFGLADKMDYGNNSVLCTRLFTTVLVDASGEMRLKLWEINFARKISKPRSARRSVSFYLEPALLHSNRSFQSLKENKEKDLDTVTGRLKCACVLLNTFRVHIAGELTSAQAYCSLVFLTSTGDLLLSVHDQLIVLKAENLLSGKSKFRLRLLQLTKNMSTGQRKCSSPSYLNNAPPACVLRTRQWSRPPTDLWRYSKLHLITEIQTRGISEKQALQIETSHHESLGRSRFYANLLKRDNDLMQLTHGLLTANKPSPKHKKLNVDGNSRQIAFSSYLNSILLKSGIEPASLSHKLMEEKPDEKVCLLTGELEAATEERDRLVAEQNAITASKLVARRMRMAKHKRKGKIKPIVRPPMSPTPPAHGSTANKVKAGLVDKSAQDTGSRRLFKRRMEEEIESEERTGRTEMSLLPICRSRGFFALSVLKHTGMWKYGWAPNSSLISSRYPKASVQENEKILVTLDLAEMTKRLKALDLPAIREAKPEESWDSSADSVWVIQSDKELTEVDGFADEYKPFKTAEELLGSKYLSRSQELFFDISAEVNEAVEQPPVLEEPRSMDKERRHTVFKESMRKDREAKIKESKEDLLEMLSNRPPVQPKRKAPLDDPEGGTTVFLTELPSEHATPCSWKLPKFLAGYKNSRWLRALNLNESNPSMPDWVKERTSSKPADFVNWLLDTGLLTNIFTQKIPPCPEDESKSLCQTTTDLCLGLSSIHVQHGLPQSCLRRVQQTVLDLLCSRGSDRGTPSKNNAPLWPVLWSSLSMLITLGFRDLDTVALLFATYMLLEYIHRTEPDQAVQKQDLVLCALDHIGGVDRRNYLREELGAICKGLKPTRPEDEDFTSERIVTDTLNEHLIQYNGEFDWLRVMSVSRSWLEYWMTAVEEAKISGRLKGFFKKKPASCMRPKAASVRNQNAVSWAESHDQAQVIEDITSPRTFTTPIEGINFFCSWIHKRKLALQKKKKAEITGIEQSGQKEVQKMSLITDDQENISRIRNLRDMSRPACAQPWKAYQNAMTGKFPPVIRLNLPKCLLTPFGEQETKGETLLRRLTELQRWKLKIIDMSIQKRQIFLQKNKDDCGFEGLISSFDIAGYESRLRSLIAENSGYLHRFTPWFIPALSCVLPSVRSWPIQAVSQAMDITSLQSTRKDVSLVFPLDGGDYNHSTVMYLSLPSSKSLSSRDSDNRLPPIVDHAT